MRIKRTLQPFVDGSQIRFGFGNSSIERSLPLSDDLLKIIKRLDNQEFDKFTTEEQKLVNRMTELGLITINKYDDSRFSRNFNFFEWVDTTSNLDPSLYQEKLFNSHILIVGVGGIGSTIAEILVRLGVRQLTIVDFDAVEESNLTRQSGFTMNDIGFEKTEVLKKHLQSIDVVQINIIKKKISNFQDLEECYWQILLMLWSVVQIHLV